MSATIPRRKEVSWAAGASGRSTRRIGPSFLGSTARPSCTCSTNARTRSNFLASARAGHTRLRSTHRSTCTLRFGSRNLRDSSSFSGTAFRHRRVPCMGSYIDMSRRSRCISRGDTSSYGVFLGTVRWSSLHQRKAPYSCTCLSSRYRGRVPSRGGSMVLPGSIFRRKIPRDMAYHIYKIRCSYSTQPCRQKIDTERPLYILPRRRPAL